MNGSPEVNEHLDLVFCPVVVPHGDHNAQGGLDEVLPEEVFICYQFVGFITSLAMGLQSGKVGGRSDYK